VVRCTRFVGDGGVVPSDGVHGEATSLSFVLPVWNEEEGIRHAVEVVGAAAATLEDRGLLLRSEVVVVDDGSTDRTPALLEELEVVEPRLRVVRHEVNGGLGAALRTGFGSAANEWIFYMDADLPVDPLVSERLLRVALLQSADIVACYRLSRSTEGVRREVLSSGYNAAVRLVTGLRVRDVNFAAKLVRRSAVVDRLPVSDSLFFDAELLARAIRGGATVQQVGVDYFPRTVGTSTLSSARSILDTARDLIRIGPTVRVRRADG